jgi:histidine triad (HIT) family protein
VKGEIPSRKVFEDEHVLAFHDINPVAPVHFLIIPKMHLASLAEVTPAHAELMGHLFSRLPAMARSQGLDNGWRTIVNTGEVGRQDVYHLHVHVIGGPGKLGPMIGKSST